MQWQRERFRCWLSVGLAVFALSACSKSKTTAHAAKKEADSTAEAPEEAASAATPPASSVGVPFGHAPIAKEKLVAPPLTAPADAKVGPGGVAVQLLREGTGDAPGPTDTLILDYSMWTGDGKLVRSSYTEERSPPFSVATLAPPLRSLLTSLKVGAKARYWIPRAALEGWRPQDWPNDNLVVELELIHVSHVIFRDLDGKEVDPPVYAPPDAAGAPASALTARGGLRYVLLVKGTGTRNPTPSDRLSVLLDGYVVDGLIVNRVAKGTSTVTTLERAPGALSGVLAQLKSGDTARVWFPPKAGAQVIPEAGDRELILDFKLTFDE